MVVVEGSVILRAAAEAAGVEGALSMMEINESDSIPCNFVSIVAPRCEPLMVWVVHTYTLAERGLIDDMYREYWLVLCYMYKFGASASLF